MKTVSFPKKWLAIVACMLFSSVANAQAVVYDPAQFGNMIKSLLTQSQHLAAAMKTLEQARNIVQQAKRTKEELEGLHKLERDVQNALKVAKGITSLKWSDLNLITQRALGLSTDPAAYLPNLPQAERLRQVLQRDPDARSARELYTLLTGFPSFKAGASGYADLVQQSKEATIHSFAFAELSDQKKLQTALSYNQIAEDLIDQANELMRAVKTDQRLTMNEAERIATLKGCSEVLVKSFELKREADELIQSVSRQSSPAQQAVRQAYQNALLRDALSETPQMKFGQ